MNPPINSLKSKWLPGFIVLFLLVGSLWVHAEGTEEQYFQIYDLIYKADALSKNGQTEPAKSKYIEAQTLLVEFKKQNPQWHAQMVSYRLKYVTEKINPPVATPVPAVTTPASSVPVAEKPKPKPATKPIELSTPRLKLIAAGAEPRTQLRLNPVPESKQSLVLTMSTSNDMGIGQKMKMPQLTLTLDATIQSVSAEGDIAYEIAVSDVAVANEPGSLPQVIEAMKTSYEAMKGTSNKGVISNRGFSKTTDAKTPAGTNAQSKQAADQIKESLASFAVHLPEEPVGDGAKWEVKMPLKSQGMTIEQTISYEMISVKEGVGQFKTSLSQHAANQKITNPAMPSMKVDVTEMTGNGSGNLTLDLRQLFPSTAKSESHSEIAMAINMGGQKQNMTMESDAKVNLEAKIPANPKKP